MGKKAEHKICYECSKKINVSADKYVILSTINNLERPNDHVYFHFQCWADHYNKGVERKARIIVDDMRNQALMIANTPALQNLLNQVRGSDKIMAMLNTDLLSNSEKVEKKIIKNGRTKNKNSKSK